MLRVLALIPGFPDRAESWPPSLLLERLAQRVEVTVATWNFPDRPAPYWHRQIQVVPLRRLRTTGASSLAALWPRPDLIHAFWALQPGALGAALASTWRVPLVVSALGGEVVHLPEVAFGSAGSRWHRGLARASLSLANAVVVGSQLQLQACCRLARLRRSLLLPVGVHERFVPQPRRAPDGRVRLLAIGSLVPVKRVSLLIDCLALLDARFSLSALGEGPLRGALESQARRLGLLDRVQFLGEREGPGVLEALRDSELVVHASAHEGGSIALLEALASARPVISTPVGAAPELLSAGAGLLAEPTAPALAHAVRSAAEALETRHYPAALRVSLEVRERYQVDRVARVLSELYEELIDRGAAPRGAPRA